MALQYLGVSSITRMGEVFDLATIHSPLRFKRAGRVCDLLVFVRAHARERLVGNAQSHEEVSLESQSFSERRVDRIADKTLDIGERFRRMRAEAFCNFHRAIDGLAADGFVHKALLFGVTRIERPPHKDVHEGRQSRSQRGCWDRRRILAGSLLARRPFWRRNTCASRSLA